MKIANKIVGPGHPCFIIAEAGVNHNGDMGLAKSLVEAAARAGADAVKFQTFRAEKMVSAEAPKATYQIETTDAAESQLDMLRSLELSPEMHHELKSVCQDQGVLFLSSAFDHESVDLLADLEVPALKVPSGEITNLPLLAYMAQKGKPLIVSTGMADLAEVAEAVQAIEDTGSRELTLLHCVSNYPADAADVNLNAMDTMYRAFGVPVGYSDHTQGIHIPLAAVALGACVIEKHLTLDRSLPGPDHRASLEPGEFGEMVSGIRAVESAMGSGRKQPAPSEANTADVARKSLTAAADIPAGTVLSSNLITAMRPGTGLPPAIYRHLLGRTAKVDIKNGSMLTWEMLS